MITLKQLIAMAKVASDADKKTWAIIRKIMFRNGKAAATDSNILFVKENAEIEGEFSINSDDIISEIKIKDNGKKPLEIKKGEINGKGMREGEETFIDYEKMFPEKKENSFEIIISKTKLEKLINCFEEGDLVITIIDENSHLIIENRSKTEKGLIARLMK